MKGDVREHVAAPPRKRGQAPPLSAKHQRHRVDAEIEIEHRRRAPLVKANRANTELL